MRKDPKPPKKDGKTIPGGRIPPPPPPKKPISPEIKRGYVPPPPPPKPEPNNPKI